MCIHLKGEAMRHVCLPHLLKIWLWVRDTYPHCTGPNLHSKLLSDAATHRSALLATQWTSSEHRPRMETMTEHVPDKGDTTQYASEEITEALDHGRSIHWLHRRPWATMTVSRGSFFTGYQRATTGLLCPWLASVGVHLLQMNRHRRELGLPGMLQDKCHLHSDDCFARDCVQIRPSPTLRFSPQCRIPCLQNERRETWKNTSDSQFRMHGLEGPETKPLQVQGHFKKCAGKRN